MGAGAEDLLTGDIIMSKSNQRSKYRPKAVELQLRKEGIYVVNGDGTPIADPISVTAFATSHPGMGPERAFTVIRFLNRRAKWKTEIVPSSMLTAQSSEFVSLLSTRAYMWPPDKKLWPMIIAALSNERPGRDIRDLGAGLAWQVLRLAG
jgi:hypothetical protein